MCMPRANAHCRGPRGRGRRRPALPQRPLTFSPAVPSANRTPCLVGNFGARGAADSVFVSLSSEHCRSLGIRTRGCSLHSALYWFPTPPASPINSSAVLANAQGCKFMLNLQMVRWIRLISRNEPNQTTNDLVVFMISCPDR